MANSFVDVVRGIAATGEGYKQQGVSGIFQALGQPQTFERTKRFDQMRRENPELTGDVEAALTTMEQGRQTPDGGRAPATVEDFDEASNKIFRLNGALNQRGLPEEDVKQFTNAYIARLGASAKPEMMQGQSGLTRIGAATNPIAAAEVGSGLRTKELGPEVARAGIEATTAGTAHTKRTTDEVIPAQVEGMKASSDATRQETRDLLPERVRATRAGASQTEAQTKDLLPVQVRGATANAAQTEQQTEKLLPQQVEGAIQSAAANKEQAQLYKRQAENPELFRRSAGTSADNTWSQINARNASAMSRYETVLQKALDAANASGDPKMAEGALAQRNQAARSLRMADGTTMPEMELRKGRIPSYDPSKPEADQLIWYASPVERKPEATPTPTDTGGISLGGPRHTPTPMPAQQQFDPTFGLTPQPRAAGADPFAQSTAPGATPQPEGPPFEVALQNPVAFLQPEIKRAFETPGSAVKGADILRNYMALGFNEAQARKLTAQLVTMFAAQLQAPTQ